MDQQNYYYGKHNIGALNYQAAFGNAEYYQAASGYSGASGSNHTHHTTTPSGIGGIGYSSNNDANNSCNDLSTATNLSRSANNNNSNTTQSSAIEFNAASYNRLHSYISDNSHTAQNHASSSASAVTTTDCSSNITYGGSGSSGVNFSSKGYGENTTNSAHVPVIAVTSNNNSHARNYHSNYPSYHQNVNDYSMHKALSQSYGGPVSASSTSSASTVSSQNRTATTGYTQNLTMNHVGHHQSLAKIGRSTSSNVPTESSKISAKTSVIKPLNAYNATTTPVTAAAPLNYTKYVPPYPVTGHTYTNSNTNSNNTNTNNNNNNNNNKTASTNLEKSPSASVNHHRGIYMNTSSNHHHHHHKNADTVYCPAPISARYTNPTGYSINSAGTAHSNSNYLTANGYPLNYGHHHLTQHQSNVTHARNLLPTAAAAAAATYQTSLDESVSANYYNRQNGIVVRPTPSPYKQTQIPYQSAYNYGRSNITGVVSNSNATNQPNGNHYTLAKPQPVQKPVDDSYNSLTLEFDSAYDRRNFRQYGSVYGSNYIDSTAFDDYSQYSNFAAAAAAASSSTFYQTKTPSTKILYNYNYHNNSSGSHATSSSAASVSTPQASVTTAATTATTTVVQQPVPINPSSSQLISSNYDTSSLHPMLPPPLFNNNSSSKEYSTAASNQYQQNPYASQILYSTLQNGAYYGAPGGKSNAIAAAAAVAAAAAATTGVSDVHDAHKTGSGIQKASMPPPPLGKYSVIDLEDQINSSKIPKSSGTVILNHPKLDQRSSGGNANVLDAQHQRHRKIGDSSSQSVIESNRHPYSYGNNNNAYNSCLTYQSQQHWQKLAASSTQTITKPAATVPTTSPATQHLHPKKQSLHTYMQRRCK